MLERLVGIPAKCLHLHALALDAVSPRLQLAGQVVVGFVQRILLVAGQGMVQLAVGQRVFRQMEQVLRHPRCVDGADQAANVRLDGRGVPDLFPDLLRLLGLRDLGGTAAGINASEEGQAQACRNHVRTVHGRLLVPC